MTEKTTPPADEVQDNHRNRRVFLGLLGGAGAVAAATAFGANVAGAQSQEIIDFVDQHNAVLNAAKGAGTLAQEDVDLIDALLRINAAAVTPPTTTTTVPPTTTTTVPPTTTTTQPPPQYDRVIVHGENFPNGFTVPAGEVWNINPGAHVTSGGNVIVEGELRMVNGNKFSRTKLTFTGANPSGFVGGHTHTPQSTDVGLWVMPGGKLVAQGFPKRSWTRLTNAANQGDTSIVVDDPTHWVVGDDLGITPTGPRSAGWLRSSRRKITAINGNTITLDGPLQNAHPVVDGRFKAEVVNLTRNVVIQGEAGKEAHVMFVPPSSGSINSNQGHALTYVELAHLAPAKTASGGVPGRYALHLHRVGEAFAGQTLLGLAAHDCNGHVFVAHETHRVTFDQCVTGFTKETPYWWDPGEQSQGVVYDKCLAMHVEAPGAGPEKFKTVGFFAADTTLDETSKMLGCVVAGLEGIDGSGFFWDNASAGAWKFQNCLAHHCSGQGVRVWQNSSDINKIEDSIMYRCGGGVFHGAYSNRYTYDTVEFHDCGVGIDLNAVSRQGDPLTRQRWVDVSVTGCDTPMVLRDAPVDSEAVTEFLNCTIPTVRIEATHSTQKHHWDFTGCGLEPSDFTIVSRVGDFRIRTQDNGTAWQLNNSGAWQSIPAF